MPTVFQHAHLMQPTNKRQTITATVFQHASQMQPADMCVAFQLQLQLICAMMYVWRLTADATVEYTSYPSGLQRMLGMHTRYERMHHVKL